jgi:tetratricopeptide (TPR) repeat protein
MKRICIGLVLLGLALPALAQGVSEATGKVVDRAGEPVQGAVITFQAKSNPTTVYKGKTSKKGRYFVSGLFTGKEDDVWIMTFTAEGYEPVEVRIESRTVNRVLVGDPMTTKLRPGRKPPEFPIRPLGKAIVDWTVAPADEVEAEMLAAQQAAAAQAAATGEGVEGEVEPAKDPWVEALTLASAGSLEESVDLFREAVENDPDDAERHETFAKILYRLEQYDEAESEAKKAVEIEPARMESQMVLFNVYDARGEFEKAKAILLGALEAAPGDTRILMRLAYVANEMGDTEGAIEAYTKVTEVDPDNAEAWLSLANLHAEAGNLEASEAAYGKVVEIDPEGAHQTYYNLGATIIKRPNHSEADKRRAIESFRKALELKPGYALAARELAFALINLGEKGEARTVLKSFVDTNPQSTFTTEFNRLIQAMGG